MRNHPPRDLLASTNALKPQIQYRKQAAVTPESLAGSIPSAPESTAIWPKRRVGQERTDQAPDASSQPAADSPVGEEFGQVVANAADVSAYTTPEGKWPNLGEASTQLDLFEPAALNWPQLDQPMGQLWADASAAGAAAGSPGAAAAAGGTAASATGAASAATAALGSGALIGIGAAGALAIGLSLKDSGDTRAPKLVSMRTGTGRDTVVLQFDEALDAGKPPAASAFTVTQAGQSISVTGVSVSGTSLTLQLASALQADGYSLAYADGSGNDAQAIQDASGNDAASFGGGVLFIDVQTQPLGVGQSSQLAFDFGEPVSTFDTARVLARNGSLSQWQADTGANAGKVYTATFTPTDGLQRTTAEIEVPASAYRYSSGHQGIDLVGVSFTVDTLPPSLQLSSSNNVVKAGQTALLTLSFTEPVDWNLASLSTAGVGSVDSVLITGASSYTVVYTPPANTAATSVNISLNAANYRDKVLNNGMADVGINLLIDTRAPTLSITSSDGTLTSGETATLTFTFSEAVSGFELADVTVSNASLSNWVAATGANAGKVYTATLTPAANFAGPSASIAVGSDAYTDLAGNAPAAASSLDLVVDTRAPQVLAISGNAAADTITITFDSALKADSVPAAGAFQITQGGVSLSATSVAISANQLTLSGVSDLQQAVFALTYTPPASGALRDLRGNTVASFMQGIVADGYIRGAKIYIDANNDGIAQDGEFTGISTRLDGSFVLPAGLGSGAIIAVGGINNDTGVVNAMPLSAPVGSLVINPLTTLVQKVVQSSGADASSARQKVARALGLDDAVDLTRFDPLANPAHTAALQVQKAAAKVATLAASLGDSSAQVKLVQALAQTIVQLAEQTNATPLQLNEAGTLQALVSKAGLSISAAELQEVQDDLGDIADAQNLGDITQAQSVALDAIAPAAPTLKMLLPGMMERPPSATIDLIVGASDGSAANAGDRLILSLTGSPSVERILTTADIKAGYVVVDLPAQMVGVKGSALSLSLVDQAGNQSSISRMADEGSDTFNLAAVLATPLQGALQALAVQELPVIGSLEDLVTMIWDRIHSDLARIPLGRLGQSASSGESRPAAGIDILADLSEEQVVYELDFGDQPEEINWDSEYELPAADDPFDEMPHSNADDTGSGGTTSGGTTNESSDTPPVSYGPPELIGRYTGAQFLPENIDFWPNALSYNAQTGELVLKHQHTFKVADLPALGHWGNEGLQAKIDANLGGYLTLGFDIQGKFNAQKAFLLDTKKSKVEAYLNLGLSEGSMIGGQLGPLSIIGTDVESLYAGKDAKRKNTGIEASLTVSMKDHDDKADDRLAVSGENLGKMLNAIKDGTFSFYDYYDLIVDVEGRLSTKMLAQMEIALPLQGIDTSKVVDFFGLPAEWKSTAQKVDDFIDQIDSLIEIFNPEMSAVLTLPVAYTYDSAQPARNRASYQTIHIDDVKVGVNTLVTDTMGPGLDILDSVMKPLYWVKDLMYTKLPNIESLPLIMDPDDYEWPTIAEDVVMTVANAPVTLVNGVLDSVKKTMDRNADGTVTLFEGMRGMVDLYHQLALNIKVVWDKLSAPEGKLVMDAISAALTAALPTVPNPVGTLRTVFDTIADSVTAPGVGKRSPLQNVQLALDITQAILDGIAQLQGLRGMYESAVRQMALDSSGSALALPLGSYSFDIENLQFKQTQGAFKFEGPGYVPPPGSDPFEDLTAKEAVQKIYKEVVAGTLSNSTVSVQLFQTAGLDFSKVEKYKDLGFKGVDTDNFAAMISLLNMYRSSLFDSGKDWSKDEVIDVNRDGVIDKEMGEFAAEFEELIHYGRLLKLVTGQGDFPNWKMGTWGESLYEATGKEKREKKEAWGTDGEGFRYRIKSADDYEYGGTSASALLKRMIEGMDRDSLDSGADVTRLWEQLVKWESLMSNKTVYGGIRAHGGGDDDPDKEDLYQYYPTLDDLSFIGLEIKSREGKVRDEVGWHILDTPWDDDWNEPEEFEEIYDEVKNKINNANKAYADSLGTTNTAQQTIIKKIMDWADGTGSGVTQAELAQLGITDLSGDWLLLFNEVIKATYDGQSVNTLDKIKTVVKEINNFSKLVNDESITDERDFYKLVKAVLGADEVERMEHILRANTGSKDVTYSTYKLPPLLHDLYKARTRDEVDTLEEVQEIFRITEVITRLTMANKDLFDNSKNYNYPADRNKDYDDGYINYKGPLTEQDMAKIGFSGVEKNELDDGLGGGLIPALKNYNYTGDYYFFHTDKWKKGVGTIWASKDLPSINPTKLTLTKLSEMIEDTTQLGFFGELMNTAPWLKDIYLAAKKNGFDFPILNDASFIKKIWLKEPVDLFTFEPPFRQWLTDAAGKIDGPIITTINDAIKSLASPFTLVDVDLLEKALTVMGVPITALSEVLPVQIPFKAIFEASVVPRLSFGADTAGLYKWWDAEYDADGSDLTDIFHAIADLSHGFYIRDSYLENGALVDRPELEIDVSLLASLGIQVGAKDFIVDANASGSASFDLSVDADLQGADEFGKVRLDDLLGQLFTNPQEILDLSAALDFSISGNAQANIDFSPTSGKLSTTMQLLADAARITSSFFFDKDSFNWGPWDAVKSWPIIDDNPNTPEPSIGELLQKVIG